MRKWVSILAVCVLLTVLLGAVACTRSKLGPAPTMQLTKQVTAAAKETLTLAAGKTVIAAEATATPTRGTPVAGVTTSPLPTMTLTTAAGPTATPVAGTTPAATAVATATPVTGATGFEYTVQTGDSLWGLALRFGTTVEAIKARNNLASDMIYKGNKLVIPGAQGGEQVTHVVQAGENLFRIALKYGTTVEAIAAANNLINPSFVYVGQRLTIVKGGTAPSGGTTGTRYHVVQPGESLWSIAMRYGTTPWKIAAANGIANINFIYAGRTLRIP